MLAVGGSGKVAGGQRRKSAGASTVASWLVTTYDPFTPPLIVGFSLGKSRGGPISSSSGDDSMGQGGISSIIAKAVDCRAEVMGEPRRMNSRGKLRQIKARS